MIRPEQVYPAGGGRPAYRVVDVRAPVEVARGALPWSLNLPILDDGERHQIGIRYKQEGQEAAIELGYRLTDPVMPGRVAAWREVSEREASALVCWRGGMRSGLAQSFLGSPEVPRVEGGYKALRAYLLQAMGRILPDRKLLVVAGMTGTGKTELLLELGSDSLLPLDLEGLAAHRGSSFGWVGEQPSQQSFENDLAARLVLSGDRPIVAEDESRRIGSLYLPDALYASMAASPTLVLEAPRSERIERIHRDYVLAVVQQGGAETTYARLHEATARLRRRLGGKLTETLLDVLDSVHKSNAWNDREALVPFIGPLLDEYYDPLYRRSMSKAQRPVLARGTKEELLRWIALNASG